MALPADFAKIFGSTFTGGLTPIADVDYSKGWEFVGSNPPTKNDFSYLQNFSDIKAKWLYDYIKTTTNAASRAVGSGSENIPDMSFFSSLSGESGYQRFPSGKMIVWMRAVISGASATITLPQSFPNTNYRVVSVDTGAGCIPCGATPLTGSTCNINRAGRAYDSSGTLQTITGQSAITIIAVGG